MGRPRHPAAGRPGALVTGQGRFTADLAADALGALRAQPDCRRHASSSIKAPDGALVITAADLEGVKKITPMLHKFSYRPVGQPILADGVVRFVGEAVAAVVAPSEEEAEDIADLVELDYRLRRQPLVDARDALADGAPQIHIEAPGNVIVEGRGQDAGLRRGLEQRRKDHRASMRARTGRTRRRWKRAPRMPPSTHRPAASR